MRELESALQEFGEFLLKAQLARPAAAPYFVRWVRRFLSRPASDEPLADQVRGFCEDLERNGGSEDWQVRQADQALRIYFVNFLKRTDWHRRPVSTVCAILFLCREVLGVNVESVSPGVKAKRGQRLPVVLSMPETVALLDAMSGTPRLMAALIYGGGLRVSECCELRIKDVDFDQGLVIVRRGKGDKDRSTLLAEVGREELRAHLRSSEARHQADRQAGLAGVWMPDALDRKYPNAGRELGWFWVFPSRTLSTDPRAGVVRRHHLSESVIQKAVKAAAQEAKRILQRMLANGSINEPAFTAASAAPLTVVSGPPAPCARN